jgi:hypothetical protein
MGLLPVRKVNCRRASLMYNNENNKLVQNRQAVNVPECGGK